MTNREIIEFDNDAEIIDLGVASLETEGGNGGNSSDGDMTSPYYNHDAR